MTENEALKRMKMCIGISASENIVSSFKMISDALDELQQYRTIGTVEEITKIINFLSCDDDTSVIDDMNLLIEYYKIGTVEEFKALKEKSVAKKPLYRQGTRYKWIDSVRERGRYHNVEKYSNRDACPNCKEDVLRTPYCERCGQKLDWQ